MSGSKHKKTQCQKVLSHLLDGRSLTQNEARQLFGVGRLAEMVDNLKKRGWSIKSRLITVTGRDFAKVRVA